MAPIIGFLVQGDVEGQAVRAPHDESNCQTSIPRSLRNWPRVTTLLLSTSQCILWRYQETCNSTKHCKDSQRMATRSPLSLCIPWNFGEQRIGVLCTLASPVPAYSLSQKFIAKFSFFTFLVVRYCCRFYERGMSVWS